MEALSAPAPLRPEHDLSRFDCGEPALNDWLRTRARANESRFSRSYVVAQGARVVAFYCLSAGAVERAAAPGQPRRNARDAIPVAILGRLAVDRAFAGRGLGADLLADALRRVARAAHSVGIAAVLVHAKHETARRFYLRCADFIEFPRDSRILFLPVETIAAALPDDEA
jgi:GNAT superfamily N-acetyltransferase